jgi:hypothetical protein
MVIGKKIDMSNVTRRLGRQSKQTRYAAALPDVIHAFQRDDCDARATVAARGRRHTDPHFRKASRVQVTPMFRFACWAESLQTLSRSCR